jgi:dipeptidase E
MKRLFLASSIETTGPAIGKLIGNPEKLQLAFIDTAGEPEDDKQWIAEDRKGLEKAGFNITDYTLTGKSPKDIENDLEKFDVIHVNGGDTFYLLIQARKCNFDKWIAKKVISGEKIYIGSSAGSIACAPNTMNAKFFENEEYFEQLNNYKGFNLVDFQIFPHWGSDIFKDRYLNSRMDIAYKPENKIILLNDWQYIKVEGDTFKIVDIRD